jgi:hypothetical protein
MNSPIDGDPLSEKGRAARERLQAQADLVEAMGRATLAITMSGFRYWQQTLEIWTRTLPLMARTLADATQPGGRETDAYASMLGELRERIRELTDAPSHEAARLRVELDRILVDLLARAPTGASAPRPDEESHWRRWRVKP